LTINILRKAALIEGTTLILLALIAVPLKYYYGFPEAVRIMGPIHGVAFLGYVFILTSSVGKDLITLLQWIIGLFAAFIPFGSFIFERFMLKNISSTSNA
jgi:integral membrane protein